MWDSDTRITTAELLAQIYVEHPWLGEPWLVNKLKEVGQELSPEALQSLIEGARRRFGGEEVVEYVYDRSWPYSAVYGVMRAALETLYTTPYQAWLRGHRLLTRMVVLHVDVSLRHIEPMVRHQIQESGRVAIPVEPGLEWVVRHAQHRPRSWSVLVLVPYITEEVTHIAQHLKTPIVVLTYDAKGAPRRQKLVTLPVVPHRLHGIYTGLGMVMGSQVLLEGVHEDNPQAEEGDDPAGP